MAKWMIPRHAPKKRQFDQQESKNRSKEHFNSVWSKVSRSKERKNKEFRRLTPMAAEGISVAKVVLGTCTNKSSLSLESARNCARSAKFELGRDIWVYECKYCGLYHLTSNPIKGAKYVYTTKGQPIFGRGGKRLEAKG